MRKALFTLFILFLLIAVYPAAVDYTPLNQGTTKTTQLTTQEIEMQDKLITISNKISETATQKEMNENFAQFDATMQNKIKDESLKQLALFIGIIILNDMLIFSLFGILKSKGYV